MINPLLRLRLETLARRRRKLDTALNLAAVWAGTSLVGALLVWLTLRQGWSPALAMGCSLQAGIAGAALVLARRPRGEPDWRGLARLIERRHPELEGRLLTAVQIEPPPGGEINHLQDRVVAEALAAGAHQPWRRVCPAWLVAAAQLGHLLALALLGFVFWRVLSLPPTALVQPEPVFAADIAVTPGNVSIERGSSLVVMARFKRPPPASAELVFGGSGEPTRRIALVRNLADPVFGGTVPDVASNFVYRIEAGDRRSTDFKVTVFDYPRLEQADALVTFPAYTRQPPKRTPNTRRISAVEGSRLNLALHLNKPVASAKLVAKGTNHAEVPLVTSPDQPLATLTDFALETSRNLELQLVDADGRTNKLPAQFVFEVGRNRTPELKVTSPRGDSRPSALQEMTFEGTAWDDFGLEAYGLAWSQTGAETQFIELGRGVPAKEKRDFTHVLHIEDLGVQPDDLVAWFVWADDLGPDGQPRRTTGDLFFAEIRPFEEIFREGQGQSASAEAQQAESGEASQRSPAARLAELQKQIISATWKLQRQRPATPPPHPPSPARKSEDRRQTYAPGKSPALQLQRGAAFVAQRAAEDRAGGRPAMPNSAPRAADQANEPSPGAASLSDDAVVREAQSQALQQAEQARQEQQDPGTSALWQAAIQQMQRALERLEQAGDSSAAYAEALAAEQAAYQALLKLQEREFSVSRSQRRGQAGNQNSRQQQMQRQLDQLELAQSENRYESESQARAPQSAERREQLQVLNRLQELARRQQDLNDRLKELQTALTEAPTEQEREEARRELKRLREEEQQMMADLDELQQRMNRPENQSRMGEQQRQLEQTRNDLQRAAEALGEGQASQALAAGSRAQRQMQQLRDDLRKETASEFEADLREMRTEARELARKQGEIRQHMDAARSPDRRHLDDSARRQELQSRLAEQRGRLTNMIQRATSLSEQTEAAEPLVSRGLYDTLRQFSQEDGATLKEFQEELLNRGLMTRGLYDRLQESVARSGARALDLTAEMLRQGYEPQADQAEARARAGITNLKLGVERAAERVLGDDTEALRRARDELDALGAEVEREITEARAGETNRVDVASAAAPAGQPADAGQSQPQPGTPNENRPENGNPAASPQNGGPATGRSPSGGTRERESAGSSPRPDGTPATQPTQAAGQGRGAPSGNGQPQTTQRQARQAATDGAGGERFPLDFAQGSEGRGGWSGGPITGGDFAPWSDRLREVEELVDLPSLRSQVAVSRERARQMRQDFRRDRKQPDWATVRLRILQPLVEVRREISEELARRAPGDQLVPVDRDPVPARFSELVRRYYEDLGRDRPAAPTPARTGANQPAP